MFKLSHYNFVRSYMCITKNLDSMLVQVMELYIERDIKLLPEPMLHY